MVLPPGEQHGVGGGLRSLTAFLVFKMHFAVVIIFVTMTSIDEL